MHLASTEVSQLGRANRDVRDPRLLVEEDGKRFNGNQIEYVNLIVDHLTQHGIVEPARLYESPFTDLTPRGPEGLFSAGQAEELVHSLEAVQASALAA